ncbi:hypothetical protein B0T16DRAFT_243334 [Cercophora newfieldiana]|uniref:Uncharacterized protein n=1 Tax=Cercophora newfieldiana TaxID=92897 RepID=A0AA39XSF4_9PEZI|nr:hypothetical protein B0T16DRAFT_243334 [Cercophora newfieldiana]
MDTETNSPNEFSRQSLPATGTYLQNFLAAPKMPNSTLSNDKASGHDSVHSIPSSLDFPMLSTFIYDTSSFSDRLVQIQSGIAQARNSQHHSAHGMFKPGFDTSSRKSTKTANGIGRDGGDKTTKAKKRSIYSL